MCSRSCPEADVEASRCCWLISCSYMVNLHFCQGLHLTIITAQLMRRIYFIWSRIGVYFSNREGNLISTCHIKPFKNLLHAVSRWRKRLSTHTKTTDAEKEKSYRKWVRSRFGSRGSDARANVSVLLAVAQQQQQTFPTQSSNRFGLFRQAGWRKASDRVCWGRFLPGRSEQMSVA